MFTTPAYAQAAGGAAAQGGGLAGLFQLGFPLVLVMVAFYLIIHRPQARRQAQFQAKIDSVKKGDSVVTGGGIVGKVTKVEDAHVEVEIAPATRIRVVKATLAEVNNPNTTPAND